MMDEVLPFVPEDAVTQFDDCAEMDEVIALLADEGFSVRRIDCSGAPAMLSSLGAALDWRAQFGRPLTRLNLDALADALRGVPSEEGGRVLLILDDFRAFEARDPRRAEGIVEAIREASADHLEVGRRLLAFVCTDETEDGGEDDLDAEDMGEDDMDGRDPDENDYDAAEEWLRNG